MTSLEVKDYVLTAETTDDDGNIISQTKTKNNKNLCIVNRFNMYTDHLMGITIDS